MARLFIQVLNQLFIKKNRLHQITGGKWHNKRTEFNPRDKTLYSNQSDCERNSGSQYYKDFLSNGFKIRSDNGGHNGSGNTYIYLAFASLLSKMQGQGNIELWLFY